jgi:hypothetical protein
MLISEGLSTGSKPRNRGLSVRALLRKRSTRKEKRYVGPSVAETRWITCREEKAPKGESHERCRREIELARLSRE